jgi:hypothetical protein
MKKYFYLLFIVFLFAGCGKLYFENRYTKKLMGTWRITEIQLGSGQSVIYPAYNFKNEKFTFKEDNSQDLTTPANKTYKGKWYVSSNNVQRDCYIAPAGNTVCRDLIEIELNALTWIPTTQETKIIYFEDVTFLSGDSFKATVVANPTNVFYYYFKRE